LRRRRWCGWFTGPVSTTANLSAAGFLPIGVTSQDTHVPAVRRRSSTELGDPQQVALAVFEIRSPDLSDRDDAFDRLEIG